MLWEWIIKCKPVLLFWPLSEMQLFTQFPRNESSSCIACTVCIRVCENALGPVCEQWPNGLVHYDKRWLSNKLKRLVHQRRLWHRQPSSLWNEFAFDWHPFAVRDCEFLRELSDVHVCGNHFRRINLKAGDGEKKRKWEKPIFWFVGESMGSN